MAETMELTRPEAALILKLMVAQLNRVTFGSMKAKAGTSDLKKLLERLETFVNEKDGG